MGYILGCRSVAKASDAEEAAKWKAEDFRKPEKKSKEGSTLYNKGVEMLMLQAVLTVGACSDCSWDIFLAAEAETKANEAAEAAKQKAEDSKKQEKETKEGNTLYNKGSEMLDAAVTMEANVRGAMLSEFFRAVRSEGWVCLALTSAHKPPLGANTQFF